MIIFCINQAVLLDLYDCINNKNKIRNKENMRLLSTFSFAYLYADIVRLCVLLAIFFFQSAFGNNRQSAIIGNRIGFCDVTFCKFFRSNPSKLQSSSFKIFQIIYFIILSILIHIFQS
uniref:Uncharacterized protein n=1 Tax=Cacopsylla melanoneura TaxID=428564 RepID=A0A8D8ZCU5_9HEMI